MSHSKINAGPDFAQLAADSVMEQFSGQQRPDLLALKERERRLLSTKRKRAAQRMFQLGLIELPKEK